VNGPARRAAQPGGAEPPAGPSGTQPSGAEPPAGPSGTQPSGAEPSATPLDGLSFELVAAALRADSADVAVHAQVLTESLGEALPPGCVTVERERSWTDRVHGRPGQVSRVTVRLGEQVLALAIRSGQPYAEICREVRGVVLSRQPVPLQQWLAELAQALMAYAQQNASAAQALRKLVAGG
jgi:hypothetical protein